MTAARAHQLFEETAALETVFPDEIAAVASGEKPLSIFASAIARVGNDPDLARFTSRCRRLGLAVEIEKLADDETTEWINVRVYVFREEHRWRMTAHRLLWTAQAGRNWSDASETIESTLLGYPPESITQLLRSYQLASVGWGLRTYYVLVPTRSMKLIARGHGRMFPTVGRNWALLAMSSPLRPRRRWPAAFASYTLLRFGCRQISLRHLLAQDLLGKSKKQGNLLWLLRANTRTFAMLYPHMRTNIESWTGESWQPVSEVNA